MSPETKKVDIAEVFLKNFVKHLVKNSYDPSKDIKKTPAPKKKALKVPFQRSMMHPTQSKDILSPFKITHKTPPAVRLQRPVPPVQGITHEPINLGKLTALLLDPSVYSVECPGPTKNILVNRSGAIQTTNIVLSNDEINGIINEISQKTRIPPIPGLFKVAFQDLVMSAVISEFVGTRFLLQKMTPFGKY